MRSNSVLDHEKLVAGIVGVALLVASYFAFSIRAVTDPFNPGVLFSAKRLIVAAVGAGLFWFVARYARREGVAKIPARIVGVALLSAAALGLVLVTRIAYDLFFDRGTEAMMVRNVRWTIIWLGYFGTALLGYFTIVFARSLRQVAPCVMGTRQDRIAAVLTEVASWSPSERLTLAAMLDGPTQYECADPLFTALKNE